MALGIECLAAQKTLSQEANDSINAHSIELNLMKLQSVEEKQNELQESLSRNKDKDPQILLELTNMTAILRNIKTDLDKSTPRMNEDFTINFQTYKRLMDRNDKLFKLAGITRYSQNTVKQETVKHAKYRIGKQGAIKTKVQKVTTKARKRPRKNQDTKKSK